VRLFVAVEIDERVAEQVMAVSDELRRRIEARAPAARLTWVPRERLHLTLRFIGEVDESRAAQIAGALQPPLEIEPFDMVIDGAGAFPPRGAPRVLWAGIVRGEPELIALERQVTARLLPCGVSPDDRPYRPHLTLARVREASGLRTTGLFQDLPGVTGASAVRTITLFQSRLSPKGPTYLPLQSTTLRWKN
jgi:RNA 2',3'-cyclic 3'-phosphodiesterase